MPVMNGLAAARQISKISPGSILVMYTLFANEPLAEEAKAAGIQAVVSKGNGEDLLAFIRGSLPTAGRPAVKHPTDSRLGRSYALVLNSRGGSLVE
jgi:CheY-like chemotaxis protein